MIKKLFNSKSFFMNTLIILMTGFLIKLMGLINRIFITRLMGPNGMNLYILSFPTIMLFISISGLSLNVTISKLVAESIKTKAYSPKILLNKAIKLSLVVSIITIIIFLLTLYPLVHIFLKNDNLLVPLSSTIFLIPLVGISDALKGYFNGIKQMKYSSTSGLLEQVCRIFFSIVLLYLTLPYGINLATFFCLLALSAGEVASIIYSIITIKKIKIIHYDNTTGELNAIIKMSVPSTISRLIGNFTYFLEPIVYFFILGVLHFPHPDIENAYTIVNAYTISLLTLGSFVSSALSTTVVPQISENYATQNFVNVNYYIGKTILFSLIPGIFITSVLFFYPSDIMNFVYRTTLGASDVKLFVLFFLPYYLQAPLSSIYQALGKSKDLFVYSSVFNVLRLILIITLSLIPLISFNSLLIATFITLDLNVLLIFLRIRKITNFRFNKKILATTLLLTVFLFFLMTLLKSLNINFIISIIISFSIYMYFAITLRLIRIPSLNAISAYNVKEKGI